MFPKFEWRTAVSYARRTFNKGMYSVYAEKFNFENPFENKNCKKLVPWYQFSINTINSLNLYYRIWWYYYSQDLISTLKFSFISGLCQWSKFEGYSKFGSPKESNTFRNLQYDVTDIQKCLWKQFTGSGQPTWNLIYGQKKTMK